MKILPKPQEIDLNGISPPPSYCTIVKWSGKKAVFSILIALLITCGAIPIILTFRFNPFLSNDKFKQSPQENTRNLLISAAPTCIVIFVTSAFLSSASSLEGKFDLKGRLISTKQALVMVFRPYIVHVNYILSGLVYPPIVMFELQFMEWITFTKFYLHIITLTLILFISSWAGFFVGTKTFTQQLIRSRENALSDDCINFKRYGIMVKKQERQEKDKILRRLKISFLFSFPGLMVAFVVSIIAGATRYFIQQSTWLIALYCFCVMLTKSCFQWFVQKVILNLDSKGSYYSDLMMIVGTSIMLDCVLRFLFSRIQISIHFLFITASLAIFEILSRCMSLFRLIRLANETAQTKKYVKAKRHMYLIMLCVEACVVSEYVAINLSFILNTVLGHYIGFSVGAMKVDIKKQFMFLSWQYFVEGIVDFISFGLEMSHPLIRELSASQKLQSRFGLVSGSVLIGEISMLFLVLAII